MYFFGVIAFAGLVIYGFVYRATTVPPSCSDDKQNQQETGIDCGGPCSQYCAGEIPDPKVRWVRTFEITPGIVHAVASLEHTAANAGAQAVPYTFALYDDQNALIAERRGMTFIGATGRTAVVETLIPTGATKPTTTRFTFDTPLRWERLSPAFATLVIKTDRTTTEILTPGVRVTTVLQNMSRASFSDLEVVAILYDRLGNALSVSRSVVGSLPALGTATVYFTWPTATPASIDHVEIVPRINPFTTVL